MSKKLTIYQIIDEVQQSAENMRRLRSNAAKEERELKTVAGFLRCTGIPFSIAELESSADEPPDVVFNNARFEVVEVLDEERKIGEELRELQTHIDAACEQESLEPLIFEFPEHEWLGQDLLNEILGRSLMKKATRYTSSLKASLDILVYLNFSSKSVDTYGMFGCSTSIIDQGWRSVSFVGGSAIAGSVIHASEEAPEFLLERRKQILRRVNLVDPNEVWTIERDPPVADLSDEARLPSHYVSDLEKNWQDAFKLPDKLHIEFFQRLFGVTGLEDAYQKLEDVPRDEILALREMYIQCLCAGIEDAGFRVCEAARRDKLTCVNLLTE